LAVGDPVAGREVEDLVGSLDESVDGGEELGDLAFFSEWASPLIVEGC